MGLGKAMRRRDFINFVGGLPGGWPLAVRAQQPAVRVLGYLGGGTPEGYSQQTNWIRQGLNDVGYVEGRNRPAGDAAGVIGADVACRGIEHVRGEADIGWSA